MTVDLSYVTWRKSSRSSQNGSCVEIGAWRKSSHSEGNGGECVELAATSGDAAVAVRDSKNPDGSKLAFSPRAWNAFVGTVKDGQLDL